MFTLSRIFLCSLILAFFSVNISHAKDKSSSDKASAKTVHEFFKVMNLDKNHKKHLEGLVASYNKSMPDPYLYEETISNWAEKRLGWNKVSKQLTKIYQNHFKESDLQSALNFLNSKSGKNFIKNSETASKAHYKFLDQLTDKHFAELREAVNARHKDLSPKTHESEDTEEE